MAKPEPLDKQKSLQSAIQSIEKQCGKGSLMKLNESTAVEANKRLGQAIDKVYSRLQESEFLIGDRFTRADLTTAALLAPLCKTKKYGLAWPQSFPEPLGKVTAPYANKIAWVNAVYGQYR